MKPYILVSILVLAVTFLSAAAQTEGTVEESGTEKLFPTEVTVAHGDTTYILDVTGVGLRKKFIIKVYAIAHYMNVGGFEDEDAALAAALNDQYAKQITMDFARGVDAEKIQNAYRDGFKKNASEEELAEIAALVDQFVEYFDKKVEKNQQYILRWLPGGIVLTTVQGADMEPIVDVTFATVLWKIWLGDDSIVDREDLVEMVIAEE